MNFPYKSITNNHKKVEIVSVKEVESNKKDDINSCYTNFIQNTKEITSFFDPISHIDSSTYKKIKQHNSIQFLNIEKSVIKILTSYFQGVFSAPQSSSTIQRSGSTMIEVNTKSNEIHNYHTKKRRNKTLSTILFNQKENFTTSNITNYSFLLSRSENKQNIGYISTPIFHYSSNEIKIQLYYYIENKSGLPILSSPSSTISRVSEHKRDDINVMNGQNRNTILTYSRDNKKVRANLPKKNLTITSGPKSDKESNSNPFLFKYNSNRIYRNQNMVSSSSTKEEAHKGNQIIENKEESVINRKRMNIMYSDLFSESNLLSLVSIVEQLYNKNKKTDLNHHETVKITLQCNRILYPYMNRDILAKYIAHNLSSNTFINLQEIISNRVNINNNILFNQISKNMGMNKDMEAESQSIHTDLTTKTYRNSFLTSMITGIKIKLSGRLTTESIIPRVTQKSFQIGSFNTMANLSPNKNKLSQGINTITISKPKVYNKMNQSVSPSITYSKPNLSTIDFSEYNTKNRLGAFTIKV